MDEATLFRPAKRRKFAPQYAREDEEPSDFTDRLSLHDGPVRKEDESSDVDISSILKTRRLARNRGGGVQFTASTTAATDRSAESSALTTTTLPVDKLSAITDRFVGHTDEVADVDKHMMAYIDSELARRKIAQQATTIHNPSAEATISSIDQCENSPLPPPTTRQPASLGQLQEISVPTQPAPVPRPPRTRKPRLDRFNRPLKPRPQRPRLGHDPSALARDQLVEAILEETRPDHSTTISAANGENQVTDETMAAQFQRDFMDALSVRRQQIQIQQQQHQHQQQGKKMPGGVGGGAEAAGPPKGPKLGGSRSARAAMMAAREREKEKKP